jgi:uncharacterized protein (TIGR01777 family)
MQVLVSGSSGMVGSALVPLLTDAHHQVRRLVRSGGDSTDASWRPDRGELDARALTGIDAVVHLAGVSIGDARWSAARKAAIIDSRVVSTRLLAERIAKSAAPPKALLVASAVGFYGDCGDRWLDESSPVGSGFLAEVCREWEAATRPALDAGVRVVHLRFGFILSPKGGGLRKMLTPFRLGLGGAMGGGKHWMSWIALDDVVGAIAHVLKSETLNGAVNLVAPNPVTNGEFTATLGRALGRPTFFAMPTVAARLAFGEMADELLLASQRVKPAKLLASGFSWQWPTLDGALRHLLAAPPPVPVAAAPATASHH